jgi:hypothetical protein
MHPNKIFQTCLLLPLLQTAAFGQADKNAVSLSIGYHNDNNRLQYVEATAKTRIEGRFQPVPGVKVHFYLGTMSPAGLIGQAVTNDKGSAFAYLTPKQAGAWKASPLQHFIASSDPDKNYDSANATADLTKARIKLDTAANHQISALVEIQKDTAWVPVAGVDVKIAIRRFDGDLDVGDKPTYTTDSSGKVQVDFIRNGLPGDTKGNLVLVGKIEDNDNYGTLNTQLVVPWGTIVNYNPEFNKRTLFASRGHSPVWLEGMAYSIILLVWGVLLYLLWEIRRMKQMKMEE